MIAKDSGRAVPIPAGQIDYLIATAARAPSVHNTQPWRFRAGHDAIELYADQRRKLRLDPVGREMLISCGAALFGLRLAVRSLGYLPIVELRPDPAQLRLLARVRMCPGEPMTGRERQLLTALPHRHTHRGPFAPEPLPAGLLAGLQHDALAEGATLALVDPALAYQRLADIVGAAGHRQDLDPAAQADMRRWSRATADPARDGVPARAFPAKASPQPGRLPQRDFDLGRDLGLLEGGGPPPAATAVLLTLGDGRADTGSVLLAQALHRLLAHAAKRVGVRQLVLTAAGGRRDPRRDPGRAGAAGRRRRCCNWGSPTRPQATARRPASDLIEP